MDAVAGRPADGRGGSATERSEEAAALLTLLRLPGVGDATTLRLVETFGSARASLAAGKDAFARIAGAPAAASLADPDVRDRVRRGLEATRRCGADMRVRGDDDYPPALTRLVDPPAVVFLRGRPELLDRPTVAIVGSRRSTSYGRTAAEELAGALAGAGVVVASGLALGIDGAAHRGALDAGGETLAVLGTGPDTAYPPAHRALFGRIAEEGLLVSEFLSGEPALPHHFPRRNRLIAALSHVVVVIEAARRSGALITAGHALDLGVPVAAVPGRIDSPGSEGANRLIRDGAHPVLGPEDVLDLLPGVFGVGAGGQMGLGLDGTVGGPAARDEDGDAGSVWRGLAEAPLSVDELARVTGLAPGRILGALTELEIAGRVRREGGTRFRRVG